MAPITLHTRGVSAPSASVWKPRPGSCSCWPRCRRRSSSRRPRTASYWPAWSGPTCRATGCSARLQSGAAIDDFLVFARKVEADVYLEVPDGDDAAGLRGGILLGNGTVNGRRALKLCIDLADADLASPSRGDTVRATVGLEDRSFTFALEYLGEAEHPLSGGAELPCAWFGVPGRSRSSSGAGPSACRCPCR